MGKEFIKKLDVLWLSAKLVKGDNHAIISNVFPDINVVSSRQLKLHKRETQGTGDLSYFYTGSLINDNNENRNFEADIILSSDKPEILRKQIWQIYLLSKAYTILPALWHANYHHNTYMFSADDVESLEYLMEVDKETVASFGDLSPSVTKLSPNKYLVVCYYFNAWKGLVRDVVIYKIKDKQIHHITRYDKILYSYHCGVQY